MATPASRRAIFPESVSFKFPMMVVATTITPKTATVAIAIENVGDWFI